MQDALICALLRGETVRWAGEHTDGEIAEFIARAEYHGVFPLLDAALRDPRLADGWPDAIRSRCRQEAISQAVLELVQRVEIARVLKGLSGARLKPLVLKGCALAYSLYPNPALRPTGDVDLLVPACARKQAEKVMQDLGYVRDGIPMGKFISHQSLWNHVDRLGAVHSVDLHWRANNSPILAKLLDYPEMESRAVAVQALGADAYALCPVHALLFSCIHRAGHQNAPYYVNGVAHPARDRLIWLYDIHLLASSIASAELEEMAVLTMQKRMTGIVREALTLCADSFHLELPETVMATLSRTGPEEPSSLFFGGGRTRQMVGDFLALEGARARTGWLLELAFPSREYMRAKYAGTAFPWLPMLYLRRAVDGLRKLALQIGP